MSTVPVVAGFIPHSALSKVDFPWPLPPSIPEKEHCSICRVTSLRIARPPARNPTPIASTLPPILGRVRRNDIPVNSKLYPPIWKRSPTTSRWLSKRCPLRNVPVGLSSRTIKSLSWRQSSKCRREIRRSSESRSTSSSPCRCGVRHTTEAQTRHIAQRDLRARLSAKNRCRGKPSKQQD